MSLKYFTPAEVASHNKRTDCWVSFFGKVFDLTSLVAAYPGNLSVPILDMAGKDISHWFDPKTGDLRTYIHPDTNLEAPYTPQGLIPHVAPQYPTTSWENDFGVVWWKDDAKYLVGRLSGHTRHITLVNTLTQQRDTIEVCEEEKLDEICRRYLELNNHAGSYTWKYLGRKLDMGKTLSENDVPDYGESFTEVAVDGDSFIPTLFVYFNDDLTVQ